MTTSTWTPKEEATLERLRANGTPPIEIARRLGRSPSAVCQHAIRSLGLEPLRAPKRFWAESDTRRLVDLFPTTTIGDIANELGRTPQSTRDKAKNEGLYRRDYPL
jgi:hypothetical protein